MTPLRSRLVCSALLVALSALLSGCYSKATGYHGKFTFAYAASVEFENFVKPIAPGAKLEVLAFANGTENDLVITAAKSLRPSVFTVESVGERSVVIKGVEPGVADLEIVARDAAGNTLVDRMFLHVAKPAVHGLEHGCTEDKEAVYVAGETLNIFHRLATSDGRPVIGSGYAPLRIDPEAALELIDQPQAAGYYTFRARHPSPTLSIRSTVDDGALTLRVVDRAELKEAAIECGDDCRTLEGGGRYIFARVRLGETAVCSQTALTKARSLTPETCSVTANLDEDDDDASDSNRAQRAILRGLKFGICDFEMTLPELDGGRGVRLTGRTKIGRLQYPDEGGGEPAEPGERVATALIGDGDGPLSWGGLSLWHLALIGWVGSKAGALSYLFWKRRRRG
jgi:hypothetical protein